MGSLGYIAHCTGRHQQAIDHYRQALTLFRTHGNTAEAPDTLDRLGHPHCALGEREQARIVWQVALELYQEQSRAADVDRVRQQLDALDRPPAGGVDGPG